MTPQRREDPCDLYFAGKHVLVTGGSEGLGLALAKRAVRGGARCVTLVARTRGKLETAAALLQAESSSSSSSSTTLIQTLSADVTDAQALNKAVCEAESNSRTAGGVDILMAAAGAAECAYFHDAASSGAFARQMQLNYLGVVHAVQAVYAGMVERAGRRGRWMMSEEEEKKKKRRRRRADDANDANAASLPTPPQQQHILIVASAMSLLNFVGYAAYSPSKWALRGLAEGLRNELVGSGGGGGGGGGGGSGGASSTSSTADVRVTVAFPPDVDTPGYARENQTKPPECSLISEGSPLYSADDVARCIVRGMAKNCFVAPNPSPILTLLQALSRGVVPPSAGTAFFSGARLRGWLALPLEMVLGFFGPLIASVAGLEHDGVARRMAARRFAGLWG